MPNIVSFGLGTEVSDVGVKGGAEGGRPETIQVDTTVPGVLTSQNLPEMGANEVKPGVDSEGVEVPMNLADLLRPVIMKPDRS